MNKINDRLKRHLPLGETNIDEVDLVKDGRNILLNNMWKVNR